MKDKGCRGPPRRTADKGKSPDRRVKPVGGYAIKSMDETILIIRVCALLSRAAYDKAIRKGWSPMTYIDYLNQFHRWRENGNPGDKLIVLYLNMLDTFNQRYWPEWAGVTTQQLMILANTANKKAALLARDQLVRAGFLEYRPGKKGKATMYKLKELGRESVPENDTENSAPGRNGVRNGRESVPENDTEKGPAKKFGCESVPENDTENDTENSPPNQTKTKTPTQTFESSSAFSKTETTTPTTGEGVAADLSASSASLPKNVMREFLDFIPGASEETRKRMMAYYYELGPEVCRRAIRTARETPDVKNKLAYLFGILRNREADGIRSGDAWDAHERERRQRNRDAPPPFSPEPSPPPYRNQGADSLDAAISRLEARNDW